ncbi:hypothetical protein BJ912DRAFT_933997 [Pholiota molesta]|nr:hypothetical protein BJ912DRAFT_933997 [Pholiota molesta]
MVQYLGLYFNTILREPEELVTVLHTQGGRSSQLPVYYDAASGQDYLKCDICSKFYKIGKTRSTKAIVEHRGTPSCKKEKERFDRSLSNWREQRRAEKARHRSLASNTYLEVPTSPRIPHAHGASVISGNTHMPSTPGAGPSSTPRATHPTFTQTESYRHRTNFVIPSIDENTEIEDDRPTRNQSSTDDTPTRQRSRNNNSQSTSKSHLIPPCPGQWVHWVPGSIWDTYAYHQHERRTMPWTLEGINGEQVRLRSVDCEEYLTTEDDLNRGNCSACKGLVGSEVLSKFMSQATGDALPHTPWIYLNHYQAGKLMLDLLKRLRRTETKLRTKRMAHERLKSKVDDYKRLIMLLSQHKIGGVSTILSISIRNGASPAAIYSKLQRAIEGVYRPRSGWSTRQLDIAFLATALGGSRLLYVFQKEESYPSNSTVKRRKPIPELTVSTGVPDDPEISRNISSILGENGRPAPSSHLVGQTLMIDGVALEEACRYDHQNGCILGVCREHSSKAPNGLHVDSFQDIADLSKALSDNPAVCHHGKDGTVLALAPTTGHDNYYPSPLVLSPSCKSEVGDELSNWVARFLEIYRTHPDGERKHGPIFTLETDGESSFRSMRYKLGILEEIDPNSEIGKCLYSLPGFNHFTGRHGLVTTSDPKHIIKRFASMIRSKKGIQIADTFLTREDFKRTLQIMSGLTETQAYALLNPADKQNVPLAVNLLTHLLDGSKKAPPPSTEPNFAYRLRKIRFLATLLSYFLEPFMNINMSLSDQLKSLATYSHLLTAMHLKHRGGFMNSALFADSQSVVKSVFYTAARLKVLDPNLDYHILFEGSDRLEGIFSNVRTQDHARNFDILQLAHKLSVGAEINAIFERNPDLYQGHKRRNIRGSRAGDHLNPETWTGDVCVGDVDITQSYLAGRNTADRLLDEFSLDLEGHSVDWDTLFSNPQIDHLRPEGDYVGSRAVINETDADEDDDSNPQRLQGSLTRAVEVDSDEGTAGPGVDVDDDDDDEFEADNSNPLQESEAPLEEVLNPSTSRKRSPYFDVGLSKPRHIDALVAEYLVSERARKSIQRNLRVRDITINESIQRIHALNDPDGLPDQTHIMKRGDLGGFLVQLPDKICFAVGEVISFQQRSTQRELKSLPVNDLSASGTKSTTVTVQILHLTPANQEQHAGDDFDWSNEGVTSQKSYILRVPGAGFTPLEPAITAGESGDDIAWALKHRDLKSVMDECWASLSPGENDFLGNLTTLPKISIADCALPYSLSSTQTSGLYITPEANGTSSTPFQKLLGKDRIACKLCKAELKLTQMRDHVGKHILLALRVRDADFEWYLNDDEDISLGTIMQNVPSIGPNPCGWCGQEGKCKTHLTVRPGKSPSILSDCEYHYAGLRGIPLSRIAIGCRFFFGIQYTYDVWMPHFLGLMQI